MGLFSKKAKNTTPEQNEFVGDNNFISNGNLYQTYEQLKAQYEKLQLEVAGANYEDGNVDEIDKQLFGIVNNTVPFSYYQYLQLCQYFINIFKYDCPDLVLKRNIKIAQMIAFFNGVGGLWWNRVAQQFIPVAITDEVKNYYGVVTKLKINLNYNFEQMVNQGGNYKFDENTSFTVDRSDVIICRIKNSSLSCWIWLKEYIEIQRQLLGQISIGTLINNKILQFTMESKSDNRSSLINFLKPNRFWVYSRRSNKMGENINIFKDLIDGDITIKYLDIFRQTMDIYNDWVGIRNNTEFKKERNTVGEVQASQGWFDALEEEFKLNFDLFIDELNSNIHTPCVVRKLGEAVRNR